MKIEIKINGTEYEVTPKETTVSKTYTIQQLKSEKIAVRCENWEQANRLAIAWGYPELWKEYVGQIHGFDVAFLEYPKWTSTPEYFVTDYGFTKTIPFSQVQFPEKRDWEVTAYAYNDRIYHKGDKNIFSCVGFGSTVEPFFIEKKCPIHSVLRSDGVEFTCQEKVIGDSSQREEIIESFAVETSTKAMMVNMKDNPLPYWFNDISKPSKKALFKTEDGVEVFDGDKDIFWVDKKTFETDSDPIEWAEGFLNSHKGREQKYVIFKHRENALQYISDNKPEYSKRQILEALDFTDLRNAYPSTYNLIKHKLGL